ncbi:unnamed protein product [Symbiodinium sp. CCMP2592]|nr:unnamed protein product [Symbiodinium sp. CCMP2592]
MCGAGRLAELLRRFKLAPGATQAELRGAYYKRAKLLHPDIAGEASQADFRRLREDDGSLRGEKALNLFVAQEDCGERLRKDARMPRA